MCKSAYCGERRGVAGGGGDERSSDWFRFVPPLLVVAGRVLIVACLDHRPRAPCPATARAVLLRARGSAEFCHVRREGVVVHEIGRVLADVPLVVVVHLSVGPKVSPRVMGVPYRRIVLALCANQVRVDGWLPSALRLLSQRLAHQSGSDRGPGAEVVE